MSPSSSSSESKLPLKPIPGDYGSPFFGAIKDRLDYFYNQGKDEFFKTRIQKTQLHSHQNQHASWPFHRQKPPKSSLSSMQFHFRSSLTLLKLKSTTFLMGLSCLRCPSLGGHRVCAYLDPSETKHTALKSYFMSVLASKHSEFIPLFRSCLSQLFVSIEDGIASHKKANFNNLGQAMSFNYIFRLFCGKDPSETAIGSKGPAIADKWLALQLGPLFTLGLPKFLKYVDDLLLHTFPLPFFLVKSDYYTLYDVFYASSGPILDKAESFGVTREEACHNLVFLACFSTYGGLKVWFPAMIKWVGLSGEKLHRQLADEIRTVIKEEGGITIQALDKMVLTKSVVYEAFRIEPPVPFQYAKAKEDIVVESHEAAYKIKKR
ncbi:hypothetical protein OIU78_001063 [Salix suchowensis]|nr:hypothetical protein OIU78_001063 [Salix suchowensis]